MSGASRDTFGVVDAEFDTRAVHRLTALMLAGLACTIFIVAFLILAAVQAMTSIDGLAVARERLQVARAIAAMPGGMNEITLHAMGETLDLTDARLTTAGQRQAGEEMVLLNPGSDRVVAWRPHRFGSLTFETVAPVRIASGAVFIAIVCFIGWRVHIVGRGLDRSRLAAAERAKTDPLTRLHNRRAFDTALDERYVEARAGGPGFVLAIIDLDDFKTTNDSFGHAAGDTVLRAVADILRHSADPGDVVARIGGDEFAVIRTGINLDRYIATIMSRLATVITHDSRELTIGASAGIARSEDYSSAVKLSAAADAALYRAKRSGRGTAELAVPTQPSRRFAA